MRFRKGVKVEVLTRKDMPSGSWRCAEIVCGNGDTYTVKYFGHTGVTDGTVMDRVSGTEIRPCPPLSGLTESWVPGDVVELFDNFSWKMATISKVLCKEYFIVRILGSLLEFKVSRFEIRTRQSWQDGKWVIIGKGCGSYADTKHDQNSMLKFKQVSRNKFQIKKTMLNEDLQNDIFLGINNDTLQQSDNISCKKSKRRHCDYEQVEAHDGITQKHRAVEKDGKLQREVVTNQSLLHGIAYRKETVNEKFIFSSFEMDKERRQQTGDVGCSSAVEFESDSNGEESSGSSVGSCSITGNNCRKYQHDVRFVAEIDKQYSDAGSEGKKLSPRNEELGDKIRMLELDAYRCTMEALYAAGPLSWDQEAMVTNLRLCLHISNDEHLMEVRNLVSADNSIPTR